MITCNSLFEPKLSKLGVLVVLSITMVGSSAQKTLAIPIISIIDRVGNRAIESIFGVNSDSQQFPPNQTFPSPPNNSQSIQTYPPTYPNPTMGYPVSPSSPIYPNTSGYPEQAPPSTYPAPTPGRSSPTIIINNY